MKTRILFILLLSTWSTRLLGQSYNGFQTDGKHTFFFSITWNGEPHVGVGYNLRTFGNSFIDYNIEFQAPVSQIEALKSYSILAGMYRPSRLRRTFIGGGAHLIFTKTIDGHQVDLSTVAIPSYVYAAPLDRKPYATAGLLLKYQTSLFGQQSIFSKNAFGTGVHADVLLERTLGFALNAERIITYHDGAKNWSNKTTLHGGSTYRLRRF